MSALVLLVLFAVPEDPEVALGQLSVYGPVDCHLEEQIEKSGLDHRHVFSRARVLPTLEGKSEQLMPFLEHPSRRVVLRAAELLCHVDGEAALPRMRALAMKYPCENELRNAAAVMTGDRAIAALGSACPYERPEVMLSPARSIASWTPDTAAAKAISSGDAAVLERTLWSLEALDPALSKQAVATLSKVNSATGALCTTRGLFRRLGKDGSNRIDPLLRGFLGVQLDALAPSRAAAWCLVLGRADAADFPLLQLFENRASSERTELEKEADKARRTPELTPFGRAYLEKLANGQHDWMGTRQKLSRLVDHRDRPALRAFMKDEANGIADRMDAAKELALLGDASGLVLWETADGLWTDERVARKALLVRISTEAPQEIRQRVEALLTKSWR